MMEEGGRWGCKKYSGRVYSFKEFFNKRKKSWGGLVIAITQR
jgi:hypothetical protein